MGDDPVAQNEVLQFLRRYAADRDQGIVRPVDHYVAQFPRSADAIRREFALLESNEAGIAPTAPAPPLESLILPTISRYRLLNRIGRGGQGAVYRAEERDTKRIVALKVLAAPIVHPEGAPAIDTPSRMAKFERAAGQGGPDDHAMNAAARFVREIRVLSRVRHPNLVEVYDYGCEGDSWHYAMELIEGPELARVFAALRERASDRGPANLTVDDWDGALIASADSYLRETIQQTMTRLHDSDASYLHRVVACIVDVSRAAHALHEGGVLHRDIKLGNVMVRASDGRPVLADLGIAQLLDEAEGRLTRTQDFIGTLRYASPEQVKGTQRPDRRSDVYSLGVVLWELLTLKPIYDADEATSSHEMMVRILRAEPAKPSKRNPAVPKGLDDITLKALEKRPDDRFEDAAAFADQLEAWASGARVAVGMKKRTLFRRFWKAIGLRHVVFAFVALVTIAAVTYAVLPKGPWRWGIVADGTPIDDATGLPTVVTDRKTGVELVLIPAGEYVRGGEEGWRGDPRYHPNEYIHDQEKPRHRVKISSPFYMGRYELMQGEWNRVMKSNPSKFQDRNDPAKFARHPVDSVTWGDVKRFCAAAGMRLPTEAEWEYACKAGLDKERYGPIDDIAWHAGNLTANRTKPVGGRSPNAWGLYDTLGNVFEWCEDQWADYAYKKAPKDGPWVDPIVAPDPNDVVDQRVIRGGSWFLRYNDTKNKKIDIKFVYRCRASHRLFKRKDGRADDVGARVVRDPYDRTIAGLPW